MSDYILNLWKSNLFEICRIY